MAPTIGDGPIESNYEEKMKELARLIDIHFNGPTLPQKVTGFVLMVFPLDGHEGRCNYISNARREDVVLLLKEQLHRFQGWPEAKGQA